MTADDDQHHTDLQAHVFAGPVWADPEEVEPEPTRTSAEGEPDDSEDDVEAHASGFG
jgi:hypothetical protein